MVAYKKFIPKGVDMDFSKFESRDLSQSKNKKLGSTFFFRVTPFLQLYLLDFFSSFSGPQDADADSHASDADCDIDNGIECKTKLNG